MMELKELIRQVSTNGRWGLAVVGPEGTTFPAQGGLRHIGNVAGISTWEFIPGESGTWALIAGDVTVHGGATVVEAMSLQSSDEVSLLLLGPQAVIEEHRYKRRGSNIRGYVSGVRIDIPGTVLAAMGLLQIDGETIAVEPPPALGGAMAEAFSALTLRR